MLIPALREATFTEAHTCLVWREDVGQGVHHHGVGRRDPLVYQQR